VQAIGTEVISSLPIEQQANLTGETVVVIGNRGEGETFPHGYFKYWLLDKNVGKFYKV
jgi:hypothetical protein